MGLPDLACFRLGRRSVTNVLGKTFGQPVALGSQPSLGLSLTPRTVVSPSLPREGGFVPIYMEKAPALGPRSEAQCHSRRSEGLAQARRLLLF